MKIKIKNKKFQNQIINLIRAELAEVDVMMDDYFDGDLNECGMKWFGFNQEKVKNDSELLRVSVWSLDGNCLNVEDMLSGKYVWLGDMVAMIDRFGVLKYVADENAKGLIVDDLMELFKGFCGGKVACKLAEVVEVKVRM